MLKVAKKLSYQYVLKKKANLEQIMKDLNNEALVLQVPSSMNLESFTKFYHYLSIAISVFNLREADLKLRISLKDFIYGRHKESLAAYIYTKAKSPDFRTRSKDNPTEYTYKTLDTLGTLLVGLHLLDASDIFSEDMLKTRLPADGFNAGTSILDKTKPSSGSLDPLFAPVSNFVGRYPELKSEAFDFLNTGSSLELSKAMVNDLFLNYFSDSPEIKPQLQASLDEALEEAKGHPLTAVAFLAFFAKLSRGGDPKFVQEFEATKVMPPKEATKAKFQLLRREVQKFINNLKLAFMKYNKEKLDPQTVKAKLKALESRMLEGNVSKPNYNTQKKMISDPEHQSKGGKLLDDALKSCFPKSDLLKLSTAILKDIQIKAETSRTVLDGTHNIITEEQL